MYSRDRRWIFYHWISGETEVYRGKRRPSAYGWSSPRLESLAAIISLCLSVGPTLRKDKESDFKLVISESGAPSLVPPEVLKTPVLWEFRTFGTLPIWLFSALGKSLPVRYTMSPQESNSTVQTPKFDHGSFRIVNEATVSYNTAA